MIALLEYIVPNVAGHYTIGLRSSRLVGFLFILALLQAG